MNSILIKSSFKNDEENIFFNGWGYTDDVVIVGREGLDDYLHGGGSLKNLGEMEGRYILAYQKENVVCVETDQFGSEPLFYFYGNGDWAVSNSFLALSEHLVNNKINLTPDKEVLDTFYVEHSICQQLIGARTLVKEIRLAPPEVRLKIDVRLSWVTLESASKSFDDLSYKDLLVKGLSKSISVAKTILENFPGTISADITGGYDSRIILGILKRASLDLSDINFCSNKNAVSDYNVASALAKKYNFKINNVIAKPGRVRGEIKYDIWKYHNLGVYLPVYEPLCTEECWFHFHGGGGEILRDFYINSPIQSIKVLESKGKKKLPGLVSVMSEFCNQNGLDPGSQHSMREFYLKSRSRLHFGRSSFTSFSSNLVMPILTPEIQAAMAKVSSQEVSDKKVLRDIYTALDFSLLEVCFDRPEKELKKFDSIDFVRTKFDIKRKEVFGSRVNFMDDDVISRTGDASFRESMLEDLERVLEFKPDFKKDVESIKERIMRKEKLSSLGGDVSRILMLSFLGSVDNSHW